MCTKVERVENDIAPSPNCMVRVKRMGNITEVRYMMKKPEIKIQKFDSETFLNLLTGEVLPIIHSENRAESKTTIKQSLRNLRDLLNANITNTENCRWLTLTYRENMQDTKRLYGDTRKFHMRMRYYLEQNSLPRYEYIECAEPQARGAWHMHVVMIFTEVGQAPFIPNETIEKLWPFGFTKIRKLTSVDNVGCYLTAYISDIELFDAMQQGTVKGDLKAATVTDENGGKRRKAIVKGARLSLYPSGFRLFRTSRKIKHPEVAECTEAEAMKEIGDAPLTFQRTIKVMDDNGQGFNVINYRQFNKARKKQSVGEAGTDGG
jgi:uncharacterized protein (DUF2164 family)